MVRVEAGCGYHRVMLLADAKQVRNIAVSRAIVACFELMVDKYAICPDVH